MLDPTVVVRFEMTLTATQRRALISVFWILEGCSHFSNERGNKNKALREEETQWGLSHNQLHPIILLPHFIWTNQWVSLSWRLNLVEANPLEPNFFNTLLTNLLFNIIPSHTLILPECIDPKIGHSTILLY